MPFTGTVLRIGSSFHSSLCFCGHEMREIGCYDSLKEELATCRLNVGAYLRPTAVSTLVFYGYALYVTSPMFVF